MVHRIVASAFIPNQDNKPQINHKDENKLNNDISNLEWVTCKENMNYGTRLERQLLSIDYSTEDRKRIARENGKAVSTPVLQCSKNGEFINEYPSIAEATRHLKLSTKSHISKCCHGQSKTAHGFVWQFKKEALLWRFQF